MPSPSEIVHTSVYLPRTLHLELRRALLTEGKSFSEWVKEQAVAYLDVTHTRTHTRG